MDFAHFYGKKIEKLVCNKLQIFRLFTLVCKTEVFFKRGRARPIGIIFFFKSFFKSFSSQNKVGNFENAFSDPQCVSSLFGKSWPLQMHFTAWQVLKKSVWENFRS